MVSGGIEKLVEDCNCKRRKWEETRKVLFVARWESDVISYDMM